MKSSGLSVPSADLSVSTNLLSELLCNLLRLSVRLITKVCPHLDTRFNIWTKLVTKCCLLIGFEEVISLYLKLSGVPNKAQENTAKTRWKKCEIALSVWLVNVSMPQRNLFRVCNVNAITGPVMSHYLLRSKGSLSENKSCWSRDSTRMCGTRTFSLFTVRSLSSRNGRPKSAIGINRVFATHASVARDCYRLVFVPFCYFVAGTNV